VYPVSDIDTCYYFGLCHFLKLLLVSTCLGHVSCTCLYSCFVCLIKLFVLKGLTYFNFYYITTIITTTIKSCPTKCVFGFPFTTHKRTFACFPMRFCLSSNTSFYTNVVFGRTFDQTHVLQKHSNVLSYILSLSISNSLIFISQKPKSK
jgi:hypothetical protein